MRGALGQRGRLASGLARPICAFAALLCAAFLCAARPAHAQGAAESLLQTAPGHDHLRGLVTLDPAFMTGLGYVRSFDVGSGGKRKLAAHADLTTLLDLSSWSLAAGASARLFDRPGFDVLGSARLSLALAQNEVHTALSYGYRLGVHPGYYRPKWYVAADLGLRGNLGANLWHTEGYLAEMPSAGDGGYWTGTTYLYLGAGAGFRLLERAFVGVRAAYRLPATFASYGPWIQPLTVGLEFGGSFELF